MNRTSAASPAASVLAGSGRLQRRYRIAELAKALLWLIAMTLALVIWRAAAQ
jgi:hypothetical protein